MTTRAIYSEENGVEFIQDEDVIALENHATVVVAVLKRGVGFKPLSPDQIDTIYCPHCEWLQPTESHGESCPHSGIVLI